MSHPSPQRLVRKVILSFFNAQSVNFIETQKNLERHFESLGHARSTVRQALYDLSSSKCRKLKRQENGLCLRTKDEPMLDETSDGPFDDNITLCMTCAKEQASHEIHITCNKGLVYDSSRKPVFSVTYSVCGPCARQVVEVKLAADLRAAPAPHDNTEASLRAELKRVRELAEKTLINPDGFPVKEVLRRIAQGTVR